MKNWTYVVNLDEYKSIGPRWIAFYASGNSVIYFHSFGVKHIPEKIMEFISNNNMFKYLQNKVYDSIMY